MNATHSIPAIALQSLPNCCWVCLGDEQVQCRPVDDSIPVVIPCPHCAGIDRLWTLIEVAW